MNSNYLFMFCKEKNKASGGAQVDKNSAISIGLAHIHVFHS